MIQGFDPRTGEPVGEPVAETTDAEVDAAVAAAVAAAPAWGAFPRRAEALEAVADALDARVGELAAIADTETALGGERLTGEVARTTGQLRLFAWVLRDGGYADVSVSPAERPVPIPFYGELGSVNPSVVLPGAAFSRPAAIATGYTGSLTLGAGQFCTNPGLLFVPEDVGLLSAIGEAVGASSGGAMLTGRIFAGFEDAVEEAAEHPGVTELAAGQPGPGPWGATPRVFQLTLKEFADDIAVLSRERFGPAGLVITYPSVEDLLPALAALAGNLVGTVHVDTGSPDDLDLARQVVAVLEHIAGRVVCNGWPTC